MERNRWIYDLIFCADCGGHVPVFHHLAPPEQALLDQWRKKPVGYRAIARQTGLPLLQAKSWLSHQRKPPAREGPWLSARCPQCRRWLRTPDARQCFHCGANWHEP